MSKLMVPTPSRDALWRPRLIELAQELSRYRLSLVSGPAGSGKTILLSQWQTTLSQNARTAWLRFDEGDVTADDVMKAVARLVGSGSPRLDRISNHLLAEQRQTFLFLDDAEHLSDTALKQLLDLVDIAPPTIHFSLASRRRLDLPVARMRVQGTLLEIDGADLAFTQAEAQALMPGFDGQEIVHPIVNEFGGWAAGLAVYSRMLATDKKGAGQRCRRQIADFFKEEVFDALRDDQKEFLIFTSLLDQLNPSLCDEVSGRADSNELLPHLHDLGAFVDRLNSADDVWVYNPAFADFLRRKAAKQPDRARAAHRRAAHWMAARSHLANALRHMLLAEDEQAMADLLEEHWETLVYKILLVERYAKTLSANMLAQCPKTLMTLAWLNTRKLRFDEARRLLQQAADYIDAAEAESGLSLADIRTLKLMLRHGRMTLSTAQDDMSDARENAQKLLDDLGDSRPYLSTSIYSQMVATQSHYYKVEELDDLENRTRRVLDRTAGSFTPVGLPASAGEALFAAGRSSEAANTLEQTLDRVLRLKGSRDDIDATAAVIALPLSRILYERNDRARASDLVSRFLPAVRSFGNADQLIAGFVTAARLSHADGNAVAALDILDEGLGIAAECGLERLILTLHAEKVRILLRTGRPDEAISQSRDIGASSDPASFMPQSEPTIRNELRAFIWARLAQCQNRVSEGIALARRWRSFCASRGAVAAQVRWQILLAQLYVLDGDNQEAQRTLYYALLAGAPAQFVRSFVDEGPAVHQLLMSRFGGLSEIRDVPGQTIDAFAASVLSAFGTPRYPLVVEEDDDQEGIYGRLTSKELEILGLVGRGMHNREIGCLLGLTEGTVKWYMQQIFGKMGVRRRPRAVEKARQLGLIS